MKTPYGWSLLVLKGKLILILFYFIPFWVVRHALHATKRGSDTDGPMLVESYRLAILHTNKHTYTHTHIHTKAYMILYNS